MKNVYLFVCYLFFLTHHVGAHAVVNDLPAIRYVKAEGDGGSGAADGLTWATASSDLQAMIDQLEGLGGGEVWVAAGTYLSPGAMFEAGGFVMKNDVAIYGGFAGTENDREERDWKSNETILSGNGEKIVINNSFSSEAPLQATAVLDGFTVRDGLAQYWPIYNGAGIYNSHASPTLSNLMITGNSAPYGGYGGGVANYDSSSPVLTNVIIAGNTAGGGGGMMIDNSSPQLINVVIIGNSGTDSFSIGGGVYTKDSSPTFVNVTISGNAAGTMAGGLYTDNSFPKIFNSIIWANYSDPLYSFYTPQVDEGSSDNLIENLPGHNQINGEDYTGDGASLFADYQPATVGTAVAGGSYSLKASSPVIDQGNNEHFPGPLETAVDVAGNPRVRLLAEGGVIDLGAYESVEERVEGPEPAITIYYVKPGGTGDGSDWDHASGDLQAMINAAHSGNQVWVAAGTYFAPGTGDDGGFQMKNGVAIYGGFSGVEGSLEERDWKTHATVLSGNNVTRVVNNTYYATDPLDATAVLDGFTITEGNDAGYWGGGGIYNVYASPTLVNLIVSGNSASAMGGGISNHFSSSPTLTHVIISGNKAVSGGGMYNNDHSSPTLTNVAIVGNVAEQDAGGIANDNQSHAVLVHVTISGNVADGDAGGLINFNGSLPEIYNSIIWGNGSRNLRGQIDGASSGNLIEGLANHNRIDGKVYQGTAEDLFVHPVQAAVESPTSAGDYRLQGCAPVINAGINANYPGGDDALSTAVDLAGMPRLRHGVVDIGAYEYQEERLPRMVLPPGGAYKTGDELAFVLHFFKPVTVSGSLYIVLTIGEETKHATFSATSENGQEVTFSYTVAAEDEDIDGVVDGGTVTLDGGSIGYQDEIGAVPLAYCVESAETIRIDGTAPELTAVSIASDNESPAMARLGNKVTVTITANERIVAPSVTIAGNSAVVSTVDEDGLAWKAEYELTENDDEGAIGFVISALADKTGNGIPDVAATTDGSSVVFDRTAPELDGAENGMFYNTDVTLTFNEGEAVLNNEAYLSGTAITADDAYELTVTDAAGNQTTVTFTIDQTPPIVVGVEDRAYYNSDVTVTFDEGEAALNDQVYLSGTAITADDAYELVVTDIAGNQTAVTFTIDKTKPIVSGVEEGVFYNSDVTVTFNEGEAMLNDAAYLSGTPITADDEYELTVTDAAGNQTTVTFTIDQTRPIVSGAEDGVFYNSDVTVTFNEGEAVLNGKAYLSGTAITAEDEYELTVTDAAGNTTRMNFTIDKTVPQVEGVKTGGLYNQNVTASFDEGEATLNGEQYQSGTAIGNDGRYELWVTDEAGNQISVYFAIDKTAPHVAGVENWGMYNREVTPEFEDGATATLNGKPFTSGTTLNLSDGSYELRVIDTAGNETEVTFVVDKISPIITGVQEGASYNGSVRVVFNEGTAMLNGVPCAWGTAVADEGEYSIVVTDAAGNADSIRFTIDKTPPEVTGITDGMIAKDAAVPLFSEGTATLNGRSFTSGTPIVARGEYELIVTDEAGNKTTVNFAVGNEPGIPSDLQVLPGNKQVELSWREPQDGGQSITDYVIQYSADGGQTWTEADHTPSVMTRAVVIGLKNNRPYSFRVAALNTLGTSVFSADVVGIPADPVRDDEGNLPVPALGVPVVVTDGEVEAVTLEVVDDEYLRLSGEGYAMELASLGPDGARIPISEVDAVLRLLQGTGAQVYVSGHGFEPGTVVTVYLFSEPELVGHITVGPNGTFQGTLPLRSNLQIGRHTLQANGVVAGGGGERSVSLGLLAVENRSQEIVFGSLDERMYGDGPVILDARATSGLRVDYAVTDTEGNATDIATVDNSNRLLIHGAGDILVTATQAGNVEYAMAEPVTQALRIRKAPLVVSTDNAIRTYGAGNPVFGLTYSGFVGGDDASILTKQPVATTEGVVSSVPGDYAITVGGGLSEDYVFTYRPGILTITKASQSVTLEAPAEVDLGAGSVQLAALATSGLPVILEVDDPQVATVSGNTLAILRIGTVRVTVTQAGDGNYEPADPVTVAVHVTDASLDFPVRVHPAVSPNGDGINEFLMIEGIRDHVENRVAVIGRNGTVLWEAIGYDNDRVAFRGIGTGQQQLPEGTYFYVVEVKIGGEWEYRKGYFVLRY